MQYVWSRVREKRQVRKPRVQQCARCGGVLRAEAARQPSLEVNNTRHAISGFLIN